MNDVFIFIVLVVLIGCGSGVINTYLRNKRELALNQTSGDVQGELDDLRTRVEVLEKIVTDERYQLSRELDQLEHRA